jgi:hypothetical protein
MIIISGIMMIMIIIIMMGTASLTRTQARRASGLAQCDSHGTVRPAPRHRGRRPAAGGLRLPARA